MLCSGSLATKVSNILHGTAYYIRETPPVQRWWAGLQADNPSNWLVTYLAERLAASVVQPIAAPPIVHCLAGDVTDKEWLQMREAASAPAAGLRPALQHLQHTWQLPDSMLQVCGIASEGSLTPLIRLKCVAAGC